MWTIAIHGSLMAGIALLAFGLYYSYWNTGIERARTIAFCNIAITQVFFSMGCRSFSKTMPQVGPLSNPSLVLALISSVGIQIAVISMTWSAKLLGAVPLSLAELVIGHRIGFDSSNRCGSSQGSAFCLHSTCLSLAGAAQRRHVGLGIEPYSGAGRSRRPNAAKAMV